MNLQFLDQAASLVRRKRFVQRSRLVRVQVVLHQHNLIGVGVAHIDQILDRLSIIHTGAAFGHFHVTLASERFEHHEHIRRAVALVFIIGRRQTPRSSGNRRARFLDQLLAGFVETNQRTLGIVGPMIDLQHVFHRTNKVRILIRLNHPALVQPRLQLVFFSVVRTVSALMESTSCNSTILSANNCKVQRARPSGALPQAITMSRASVAPSIFLMRRWQLGRRASAASRPSSTSRCRSRWTVDAPTSKASAISGSDQAGPSTSAFKRILARKSLSAATRLPASNSCNDWRSESFKRATYLASLPIVRSFSGNHEDGAIIQNAAGPVNSGLTVH